MGARFVFRLKLDRAFVIPTCWTVENLEDF
jgi:hypothetical protein